MLDWLGKRVETGPTAEELARQQEEERQKEEKLQALQQKKPFSKDQMTAEARRNEAAAWAAKRAEKIAAAKQKRAERMDNAFDFLVQLSEAEVRAAGHPDWRRAARDPATSCPAALHATPDAPPFVRTAPRLDAQGEGAARPGAH